MAKELLNVVDIFENEEFTLIEATFSEDNRASKEYSIGLKNNEGDIFKIVTINEMLEI